MNNSGIFFIFIVPTKLAKPAHLGYSLLCPTFSSLGRHQHWNSPVKKSYEKDVHTLKYYTIFYKWLYVLKMEKTDDA